MMPQRYNKPYASVLALPGVGVGIYDRFLSLFSGTSSERVAVWREAGWNGSTALCLGYSVGGDYFLSYELQESTYAAGQNAPSLNKVTPRRIMVGVNQDAAGVTFNGTWGSQTNNASAYGGSYRSSGTAGAYVEYTTPANTRWCGGWVLSTSGSGLALVTIDGDATRATLLPTAQQLVDAGEVADTVLVGNGGTLNPTDRIWDCSPYYHTYPQGRLFADDLAAGAHTIRVTVCDYRNVSSSNDNVLFAGFAYGGAANIQDANVWPMRALETPLVNDARNEISHYALPTGATHRGWVGHLSDTYWSWKITNTPTISIDGVPWTMTSGTMGTGSHIVIVTPTYFRHSEIDGGGTNVATCTFTHTLTNTWGVQNTLELTWLTNGDVQYGYNAMLSVDDFPFDRGRVIGDSVNYDLSLDDDTVYGKRISQMVIAWETGGHWAAMAYVPDPAFSMWSWAYTQADYVWIKDAVGGFQKFYWNSPSSPGLSYSTNDIWRVKTRFYWSYFADPDASLSV